MAFAKLLVCQKALAFAGASHTVITSARRSPSAMGMTPKVIPKVIPKPTPKTSRMGLPPASLSKPAPGWYDVWGTSRATGPFGLLPRVCEPRMRGLKR